MDTRIWMQESFWERAEKQSVKESPQENAEHLSKDQNENGGNKLVDQKTSCLLYTSILCLRPPVWILGTF